MHLSEQIIEETIEYIKSFSASNDENERIINILSSRDKDKIKDLMFHNTLEMFTTPIIKELYKNEELVTDMLRYLILKNKLIREHYIGQFSKWIDLKDLFNQPIVIEFLNDENNFKSFLYSDIIFKNINDIDRNRLIDNYMSKNEITDLSDIAYIADSCFLHVYNNLPDSTKDSIKESFVHRYYSKFSEYAEEIMWNEVKDDIKNIAITEKISFIKSICSEKLKQEVFKYFEFDKNLDLVINVYGFNIENYVSEDVLFEKFKSLIDIDKFQPYFSALSEKKQFEGIKLLTKKKIPFYKFSSLLKLGTYKLLFDVAPKVLDAYKLYDLYKEYGDTKFLERIKEIYLKSTSFYLEILCEDDFVNLLNEEEKKYIIDNLKKDESIKNISGVKKYNNYFFKYYVKNGIEDLEKNPDKRVFITLNALFEYYTEEEQMILIRHIPLANIISSAIDNYDDCFNKLMNLLEKNENLLKDLPNITYGQMTYYGSEEKNASFNKIIKYIDEKDFCKLISSDIIKSNEYLKNYYIENVLNMPSMVTSFELFDILSKEKKEKIVELLDIKYLKYFTDKAFLKLENNDENKNILLSALYKRFYEYIEYNDLINYFSYSKKDKLLYFELDDEHKKIFIEKTANINSLFDIVRLSNFKDENAMNKILKLYDITNIDVYVNSLTSTNRKISFSELDADFKNYIISKMNFNELLYTFTYYRDSHILDLLIEKIHENNSCLIDESVIRNIDVLYYLVDDNEKEYIVNSIKNMLGKNELFTSKYKFKVKDMNMTDGINYLNLYKKGCIENNQDLLEKLLDSNPFLFKSIRSIFFNPYITELNFIFLDKLSKYNDLQEGLKIISLNEDRMILFNRIAKYLEEKIDNKIVYDIEISEIIEYLSSEKVYEKLNLKNVDYSNIADIVNYILCDYINCVQYRFNKDKYETINEMCDLGFDNFIEKKKNKCDELFEKAITIEEMKNIYFNKYFSLSLTQAEDFYKTYAMNYQKVSEYASSNLPLLFIDLLTKIIHIDDPITLKELYVSNEIYFDLTDIYEIEAIMKDAYSLSLCNQYQNKQNGTLIRKSIKDKDGNIEEYEMTELLDNFGLIVHSTCAYGEMPLRDNDYYVSWNYNPNTENHGICCSYITNSSYGTAAVTGSGVMLGFTNITPNTIAAYSPYDLATKNTGFNIECRYTPYCTVLDEIDDYTRHTHNEFNLERRISDGKNFCLQPDCIIILEDMDESIKANSIKAYNDFKKHNLNTKLIYIDRVKIAKMESDKLDMMIKEYLSSKDLSLLAQIINKYESNLCSSDFLAIGVENSKELYDMNEMFKTDIITKLLFDTLDEITILQDKEKLSTFINIMEKEQFKFDLIDDKNPDRKHTFKLYSYELKEKIQESINILNKENTKMI